MYSYFVKYSIQVIISGDWEDDSDTVYRHLVETDNVLCESNIHEIAPQLLDFADCNSLGGYRVKILDISYLGKINENNASE